VPGIIAVRARDMGPLAADFFASQLTAWFAGALLLFGGLLIIAFDQYWSSAAAVVISLFGWFLALRGVVLLAAPQLIERGVAVSARAQLLVQVGFGVAVLIGLWLTYVGWLAKPDSSLAKGVL
jgi:hypothetical protein